MVVWLFGLLEGAGETQYLVGNIFRWFSVLQWVILAAVVAWATLLIAVGRIEKQYIHMLEPVVAPGLEEQSPYTRAMNQMAKQLGFVNEQWFVQNIGGPYKGTATMWRSPDASTILIVSGGTVAGVRLKKTILLSKVVGGPVLFTRDETGTLDLSGFFEHEFLLNADLGELWELHQRRIKERGGRVERFRGASPLADYEALEQQRVDILVEQGLAYYVSGGQRQWRYSIRGAMKMYYEGWRRQLKMAEQQMERIRKKRPGE